MVLFAAKVDDGVWNDRLKRLFNHAGREIFQADIACNDHSKDVESEYAECGKKKGALC